MTSEFNLIKQYFTRTTQQTDLGIGDDAALIRVSEGHQLVISTDMSVAGTHFFSDTAPYFIGWKSLAVNISDMAAMGAKPKWATLAIALPEVNEAWLAEFSRGFFACANAFDIDLIGGDTTRGSLNISVTIMGEVPTGQALQRDAAQVGDDIWVSGNLGDAALALVHLQQKITLPDDMLDQILPALHLPQPRVALGLALRTIAHSAIDISDGLLADLGHILTSSHVGAYISLMAIPSSVALQSQIGLDIHSLMLAGGDDYELCFTASATQHQSILKIGAELGLKLSCIGKINQETGLRVLDAKQKLINIKKAGYDHFTKS